MSGRRKARETVTALTPARLATSASVLRFLRMIPSHRRTFWSGLFLGGVTYSLA
jgi:hypothetical protein